MDSGNNSNQQQRYCPTPIMAPPSVAGSPPIMGGNVMASIHQTPHHPPPSISPHPAAYYGHHAANTSHYPTPSPTPPPIHHQQYYAHSYYAHGSHQQQQAQQQQQQQQPQQSQQQHHGMSNAHVPLNPTPTAHQQGQQQQQHPAHLMQHTSYHHSQPQTHHQQQWAAPPHPHQQQSHHYYHQTSHHQQQPQQHGYPPPPHSPYPYTQPHAPPPTPPPHSPHPQQQQHIQPQQPQQQQHQSHPPVPSSPCPTAQMHQPPPQQQQQPQNHALMNLSRLVSQQNPNPSPCPSPRASPSLASHLSQVPQQMAPQSPSPFSGHLDHHHSNMNGHVSAGPTSPMSPPPPLHHSQQQQQAAAVLCASPPPPPVVSQQHQQQHHNIPIPTPQQLGYNINGGGGMGDIVCSSKNSSSYSDKHKQSDEAVDEMLRITAEEIRHKERDMLSIFPNLSSTLHSTNDDTDSLNNMTVDTDQSSKVTSSTGFGDDNSRTNICNAPTSLSLPGTIMSSGGSGGEDSSSSTTLQREVINNGNTTPDIPNNLGGCGATMNQSTGGGNAPNGGNNNRASVSPQMKPMGSPTNPGNGHQMMPVRLQNMQKGARTKASMKKLMQEQQITTPNGQVSETSSDPSPISAKESDSVESYVEPAPVIETKSKAKSSPKKKKSVAATLPIEPFVAQSSVIVSDLTTGAVSSIPVARPGYTKSGKKIGRPRKDSSATESPTSKSKSKGKKGGSKTPKKTKASSLTLQFPADPVPSMMQVPESELATALSETVASLADTIIPIVEEPNHAVVTIVEKVKPPPKSKAANKSNSRKRSSKLLNDATTSGDEPESLHVDLNVPPLIIKQSQTTPVTNEFTPITAPAQLGGKRRKQSKSNMNTTIEQPEVNNPSVIDPPPPQSSSEVVTEQEADEPVVPTRVVQSIPSHTTKKGKRRKSSSALKDSRKRKGAKQRAAAAVTLPKVIPNKEPDTSPERRDLPRLRSRSPKQGESPPLRISSPRAAKERSSTPASSTTPQTTPQRPRSSRERDASRSAVITSPLSSPTLRSPKKESARGKASARKGKQKVQEVVEPQDEVLLSPPPSKRLRQMSKESSESEVQGGRRRSSVLETRLSIESEKSRPLAGKRSSRRKSGSVSGSIDNNPSLSSPTPSFSQSIPSETSMEVAAHSSSLDSSFDMKSDIVVTPTEEEDAVLNISIDLPTPTPRRKGKGKKAVAKPRSRLKKNRNPSTEIVEGTIITEDDPIIEDDVSAPVPLDSSHEDDEVPLLVTSAAIPPNVKSKSKQRKSSAKKRKKVEVVSQSIPEPEPLVDSPEPSVVDATTIAEEVQVPVAAPKHKRKGKTSSKAKKASKVPIPPAVLNIPEFTPPKKEPKPRASKGSKQGKRSSKKAAAAVAKIESDVVSSPTTPVPAEAEPAEPVMNEEEIIISPPPPPPQSIFNQPQDLSPSRRRRPSVVSQSAKSTTSSSGAESPSKLKSESTVAASPAKSQRRDSRSVSRDYDVSVVLTDIAQSLSSGEYSHISNPLTRQSLQSQASNSLPLSSSPLPNEPNNVSPMMKVEDWSGNNSEDLDDKGNKASKKRRQSSKTKPLANNSEELPANKNKLKPQNNKTNELLERKATLEAEVAQVLLEMKSGNSSSSKSPSPAKSIPIVEPNEEPITTTTPRKKQPKQRKRKNSSTPRRSQTSVKVEAVVAKQETELDSSESFIPDASVVAPPPNLSRKRKSAKEKPASKSRASKAKSLIAASDSTPSVLSSTPIAGSTANLDRDGFSGISIALTPVAPVTTVKVARTASIPTASSVEMGDTPVYAVKSKPELKPKNSRKRKERIKLDNSSPDITAFSSSQSTLATPATPTVTTTTPKRKSKKASNNEESGDGVVATVGKSSKKSQPRVPPQPAPSLEADVSGVFSSPEVPPVKPKRQRKRKTESVAAIASSSLAQDSADATPSTSKLFPFRSKPKAMKPPTVFAKTIPFVEDKVRKYEDNQKKKANDGPSLKVVGGLTKFYRGNEEEELDQDPRLPKDKASLPTDNAVPWICCFCHLGPHAQKLGDLYGPYFPNLPSIYGAPSNKRETWFHGDCSLWSGRLLMISSYIRRLEISLQAADKEICTICGKTGATISCLRRHCKQAVHFPCAIRKFWKIDESIFQSYCPEHIP